MTAWKILYAASFTIFLLLSTCGSKPQISPEDEISKLLIAAFDSLESAYTLNDNQFLVHNELPSDWLRNESVSRLSAFLATDPGSSHKDELELLNDLSKVVNDSLNVDLREIQTTHARLLFYETPHLLHDENFYGSFEMSKPAFDTSMSRCAFYLAIHCGNSCSTGNVFFAAKKNGIWVIKDFYSMWGSKRGGEP